MHIKIIINSIKISLYSECLPTQMQYGIITKPILKNIATMNGLSHDFYPSSIQYKVN